MTDRRAKLRIGAGLAVMAALLGWSLVRMSTDPSALPIRDFVEYYSAGRVFLDGGNPYSGPELVEVQRRVLNRPDLDDATMMWNPPWTLTLVAPFAVLPVGVAHKAWMLGQLLCVFGSVWMLWRVYGGAPEKLWVAWGVAATFAPVAFVVWWGQIGGLVLLGLAGYLFHITRGRPFIAGLFAALTAIKPHLLFAFGLVLVLEAMTSNRGRKVVLAGAVAVAVAAVAAWVIHPAIYELYRHADWEASSSVNVSPKDWIQPNASYWLRVAVDRDRFGIQFLPTAVAAIGVCVYWARKRRAWDWPAELPRLVFVSTLAAAYGAWMFDLVVLLVPVVQAVADLTRQGHARANRTIGLLYLAILFAGALVPMMLQKYLSNVGFGLHSYFWFAPAVLAFSVAARRVGRPYNAPRESPSGTIGRASAWRTPATAPGIGS
ncbi:MAG TPA: glycosyltransferase family 87 protein [Fimbriiglobus sp.]|jgi:hypothetical protein